MTKQSVQDNQFTSDKEEIDIWLIRDNLKISYEERIARHQDTLNSIEALQRIGQLHRAKSAKPS